MKFKDSFFPDILSACFSREVAEVAMADPVQTIKLVPFTVLTEFKRNNEELVAFHILLTPTSPVSCPKIHSYTVRAD